METKQMKMNIENYMNEVKYALREPILERDVGEPPIDALKSFFLLLPLLNGEKWTEQLNTTAVAVGAVHAAFDAHDMIDLTKVDNKQQQLTVLSGDHYSGIHYRLLASIPDFDFIRTLSQTIGQINEVKTIFHEGAPDSPEKLIKAIRKIEGGCITEFLNVFDFSRYTSLVNTALPLLWLHSTTELNKTGQVDGFRANLKDVDAQQAIRILSTELQEAVEEASFLMPFLQSAIRQLTIPLLENPI
ncbi:heptaprenyl diphosphate synthase component 1 [Filibacter tadaridae]|uniref:Heptaprenyl diphosphate synthase component 1 n=1 Tax=Filibacter tadaridae TaxID=2483811 RepID=A0A3P5XN68_9BACL|nr:heptaprenyl diphosphate synthase component 1 [Filibacter tadaridae]VDC29239.1 Heptaprenyl diphosphate synthase component 1 [Filibacter tadaridae]